MIRSLFNMPHVYDLQVLYRKIKYKKTMNIEKANIGLNLSEKD